MNAKAVTKLDISFIQVLLSLEKEEKQFAFAEPSEGLKEHLQLYRLERYLD